jgi:hypothetical protein
LQGEQHHDREQQPVEGERVEPREQLFLVPLAAARPLAEATGEVAGEQRDPRNTSTEPGMDSTDTSMPSVGSPSQPGSTWR